MSKTSSTSTNCSTTPTCARSAPESASRSAHSPFIRSRSRTAWWIACRWPSTLRSASIIHTGDFKVDPTPTDNRLFDLHAFAEYGKEGVLALLQDSTNVERKGYTPSERAVRRKFDEVFARHQAAAVHLLFLVVHPSHQAGRRDGLRARPQSRFIGRSMNNSAEIAEDLGYIEIPDGLLIHPGEMKNFPPEKVCVLISGTQGEPMSALSRAAVDNHKHAKIEKGDTVVLSSRIIPGNEKAIYRMIDHLFRREAHVIYDDGSSPPMHVSGHASQEELKLIINLVKPKYFIPIHGEYRQLKLHAELAGSMHGAVGNVMLIESGDVLEFDELGARKAGRVNVGRVCIDSGSRTDVVEDLVIKDRRHLSEDGIVLPDHRHQQADRQGGNFSGNRDPRISPAAKTASWMAPARLSWSRHSGTLQRRRKGRLRRDQREDPRRPETLHFQADAEAAADHAGDSGDLSNF